MLRSAILKGTTDMPLDMSSELPISQCLRRWMMTPLSPRLLRAFWLHLTGDLNMRGCGIFFSAYSFSCLTGRGGSGGDSQEPAFSNHLIGAAQHAAIPLAAHVGEPPLPALWRKCAPTWPIAPIPKQRMLTARSLPPSCRLEWTAARASAAQLQNDVRSGPKSASRRTMAIGRNWIKDRPFSFRIWLHANLHTLWFIPFLFAEICSSGIMIRVVAVQIP